MFNNIYQNGGIISLKLNNSHKKKLVRIPI